MDGNMGGWGSVIGDLRHVQEGESQYHHVV